MNRKILVLRSLTYAYKAQRILDQAFIRSALIRTPEKFSPGGCSYSLSISENGEKAADILRGNGITVLRVISNP